MFAFLLSFAVLIGTISQSKAKFDYIITISVSLSMFLALFIGLYFDEGCEGMPQLSLSHALNTEYYKMWLPIVILMTLTTFATSFKPIRLSKILGRNKEK